MLDAIVRMSQKLETLRIQSDDCETELDRIRDGYTNNEYLETLVIEMNKFPITSREVDRLSEAYSKHLEDVEELILMNHVDIWKRSYDARFQVLLVEKEIYKLQTELLRMTLGVA